MDVRVVAPQGPAGPCADGCAPLFEPAGAKKETTYNMVGQNRGEYEMVPNYSFVGEGQGSYKLQDVTTHDGMRLARNPAGFIVMGFLTLVILILLCQIPWFEAATTTTTPYTTPNGFDCSLYYDTWQTSWSAEQKAYCCSQEGKGCESAPGAVFDCSADYADWGASWALDKKAWCCLHYGRGCDVTTTPTTPAPTTTTVLTTWVLVPVPMDGSTPAPPIGGSTPVPPMPPAPVPAPAPAPQATFDCMAGYANWQAGWSMPKQQWCCSNVGKGCPGGVTAQFDCEAGYANWQAGWSVDKKEWCCSNKGKGCPDDAAFDCSSGTKWVSFWGLSKKQYCCQHAQIGC